uniref:Uncharacterized protein n=1 Tax=Rhizophora mucronata TaxID=61149 RepID=A0A2P2QP09_RHIMU
MVFFKGLFAFCLIVIFVHVSDWMGNWVIIGLLWCSVDSWGFRIQ